ncbi:MAG: RNA-guided pseudouridylation complex pseudouridine synthase subunit Cbf5 [Thermosphaera sp.]
MTGVLPVGLDNSTKVIGNVVHSVKEYVMVVQLHEGVDSKRLEDALKYFTGEIYQRPPLRSSVKRVLRTRRVHEIRLLDVRDKFVLIRVSCDPGTYMRKLAHDMGLYLGVGAHMRELRRTRTGPYREDETLVKLQDVSDALYLWRAEGDERLLRKIILPVETAVAHLPKIIVNDLAVDAIAHGASLAAPGVARLTDNVEPGSTVAIFTLKGELVALAKALRRAGEIASMEKGIVAKTKRVLMPAGVYPRYWKASGKE